MPIRFDLSGGLRGNSSRRPLTALLGIAAFVCLGVIVASSARADAYSALPAAASTFKMRHSASSPHTFTPATLEDHIDGEAQAVKEYDFRKCAYAEYAPNGQGTQLITVDIFEFGSAEDAYGYYAGQRSRTAKLLKIGAEGYQEETAFNFWKGPYYVRIAITASHAPASFQQEMPVLARAIAAKLNGATSPPAEIGYLPPGYTPRSETFKRGNVAAQSYLQNGVLARYPSAGQQAELFLVQFPSAAAAKQGFAKYQAYVTGPNNLAVGAKSSPVKGVGDSAFVVKTKFTGQVVAGVKGKYMAAVRKAANVTSAESLVKSALSRAR